MSKFKAGDKVRVLPYDKKFLCTGIGEQALKKIAGNLYTITDVRNGGVPKHWYYFEETKYVLAEEMLELSEQPRREFIAIHQNGNVMIAEHRVNREVIKSAKATCTPSDTFDFDTGAKLAFDRLMGRDEPKPEPKPAHRFKVGDRVDNKTHGVGVVKEINDSVMSWIPYWVVFEDHAMWLGDDSLSPAPAPEPPKYYTGKVVCISGEYGVGRIFTVKDGFFADRQYNCPEKPYKSVDDMNDRFLFGKFAEAKE